MVVNNGEHIGVGSMSQFLGIPRKKNRRFVLGVFKNYHRPTTIGFPPEKYKILTKKYWD